ncbi:hypothetical protein AC1031_000107 [Aphanomyces cochlioides]|nr:hypothetical protein AC1031_000107 [Aphanomyces cochlioides]
MAPTLRIRALGGRNLPPKTAIAGMFESKQNPFVALIVGTEEKHLAAAKGVLAKEFTWGDDAVCEFAWPSRDIQAKLHVKEKDTHKERYIGGAKISLAAILTEVDAACASITKAIDLEFSDEKFKTKKDRGQITLAFEKIGAEAAPFAMESTLRMTKGDEKTDEKSVVVPEKTAEIATKEDRARVKGKLRIQALGGGNLAPKTGVDHMMDPDPDPYLILKVGNVTKTFPQVDNVKTKEFEWGADAVHEFDVGGDVVDVAVHCKDKDILMDHYIGGALVNFQMREILPKKSWDQVIELDYAAPEFKSKAKSSRGHIKLRFSLLVPVNSPKAETANTETTAINPPKEEIQTPTTEQAKSTESKAADEPPRGDEIPKKLAHDTLPVEKSQEAQSKSFSQQKENQALTPQSTAPGTQVDPEKARDDAKRSPEETRNSRSSIVTPTTTSPQNCAGLSLPGGKVVKRKLKIQAVGGSNLAPKTGIGHMMDSDPDPYLTIQVGSTIKNFPGLDNVKTKDFLWGSDAIYEFQVSPSAESIPVAIHCKDKDLISDHYIGGASIALNIADFGASKEILERKIQLDFEDAALKKKSSKSRGELTLSFYLVEEIEASQANLVLPKADSKRQVAESTTRKAQSGENVVETPQRAANSTEETKEIKPIPPIAVPTKRTLKIQAVGGSNLAPKTGIEHMMDADPDPYLTVQVGKTVKHFPVLDNVKTKEFTWGLDAVHEFDVVPTDTSITVAIHCKDKDLVVDHYIGGASVVLHIQDFGATNSIVAQKVHLEYVDAALKKKSTTSRGELTLSFYLVDETSVPPLNGVKSLSPRKSLLSARVYKGTLTLIAHSAKGLPLPPRQSGASDRRSDPYVVFQIGSDRISCAEVKDGHTTPKWPNAKQSFKIDTTVHGFVDIAIFDKKDDRFMAGTRLRLVDYLANLTNHIQATVAVKCDCNKEMQRTSPVGELQLSLLFIPWDSNQVAWKGAAAGVLKVNSVAIINDGGISDKDLLVEITIRRHAASVQGYLNFQTSAKASSSASDSKKIGWEDETFDVPYALFLHEKMTKDKCPVVVFALKDKHEIHQDKAIAENSIPLLDLLGLSGPKQLTLVHPKDSTRVPLEFAVNSAVFPPNPGASFASTPGTLRIFVLGAESLTSVLTWTKVKATVVGKSWGRGNCTTEEVDATSDGLIIWNSAFEAQVLPIHIKTADAYSVSLHVSVGTNALSPIELSILELLEKHQNRDFNVDIVHDRVVVCQLRLALAFVALEIKEALVSPRTSCVDFGAGTLHLVIYKAENLIPDKDVPITEIDPEVRVAIKPRYTKQKEIRSSAKTRPLENAGANPTWNEYLKVEFVPPSDPSTAQVSPMLCVSINDIQMPGEEKEMNVVGAAEIPLAAFVTNDCHLFSTKLSLLRDNQATGCVYLSGIYESKTAPDLVRKNCHAQGQKLRLSTPSMDGSFSDSSYFPGRLEILVSMAKDLNRNPLVQYRCELCLSSNVDERVDLVSRKSLDASSTDIVWDNQITLFTQTAKSDFLRVDIFQERTLIGWAKIPIATYSQEPRKSFREYHDVVLIAKETAAVKPRILLELTFFTDQSLQAFINQSTDANEQGYLYATLEHVESRVQQLANKKISLRLTLVHDANDENIAPCATFSFQTVTQARVTWKQTIALECPANFAKQAIARGSCPLLWYELLDGSSSALGNDAISRDPLAIHSLLCTPNAVLTKRLANSTIATTPRQPVAYTKLHLVYICGPKVDTKSESFLDQFTEVLTPNRGTLSMRIITGRNLTDVDIYGDQDPYIQLQVEPTTYQLPPECAIQAQTGVCLNSGRHPVWNSPAYPLSIHDSNVELVTLRVLDSGEEEQVPDTLIGSCQLSLYSLLKMGESDPKRWNEAWFHIYNDGELAGEIRLEYRFVRDNKTRICMDPPTKYINCQGGNGNLMVKVVAGSNLPCAPGMFPAVRLYVDSTKVAHVTQAEKKYLLNPTWNEDAAFEIEWTSDLTTLRTIRVEVVDKAAGTTSTLPIIAHCTVNIAPFVIHPHEIHHGMYPLTAFQMRKDVEQATITLSFQFIPFDSKVTPFDEPIASPEAGQIHIKVVDGVFWSNNAFRPFVSCCFRNALQTQVKQIQSYHSELDEYSYCPWNQSLLFDFNSPDGTKTLPMLDMAIYNEEDTENSIAELNYIPLLPFVLLKGHVNIVWYPLYKQQHLVAQIKMEIQFLKTSPVPKSTLTDVLTIEVLEGRGLRSAQDGDEAQDPYVVVEFLAKRVQTSAHIDGGTSPVWHETFELPLLGLQPDKLPVLSIQVMNQDPKRHGDGFIGNCTWVVPKEVLYDGKLRDVFLTLGGASDGVDIGKESNGEIQIRLKRGHMPIMDFGDVDVLQNMQSGEQTRESTNLAGLLYVFGRESKEIQVALVTQNGISNENQWTTFVLSDMAVLTVPWQEEPLKRHLPHLQTTLQLKYSKKSGSVVISPDELHAIFRTPNQEFRHKHAVQGAASDETLELSLVYVAPTQGVFKVGVEKIESFPTRAGNIYYIDMRVLRNSSWVKTPNVKPSKENKDQLSWKTPVALRELQYTNFREHVPPQLQLVLYMQEAKTDTTWIKVAYTQLNLLQYIVSPSKFDGETVPLTCVTPHALGQSCVVLSIEFSVVPTTSAIVKPEDAVAAALKLAEGTAELKKSFLMLGGDESKPLDIATLHAATKENSACMHVLQQAADLVGGLDVLFAAMDSNKDGKLSWEVYLDRMQTIHALADEAATKPSKLTQNNIELNENGELSDDDSESEGNEDKDVENAAKATAKPTGQPISFQPWKMAEPKQSYWSNVNDDDGIDNVKSPVKSTQNPAIAPMVALTKTVEDNPRYGLQIREKTEPIELPRRKGPDELTVQSWKVGDVSRWLEVDMELPQYIPDFVNASVDGCLLLSLTPEDLDRELKVFQPLHVRKIITKIHQLRARAKNPTIKENAPVTPAEDANELETSIKIPVEPLVKKRAAKSVKTTPVDLNEKGRNEIERSKLEFKAQAKKKAQNTEKAKVDRTTKTWTFEYTGEAKPKILQSAAEKVTQILQHDKAKSAYEGAMDEVLAQVMEPSTPLIQIPLITNTDEVVEIVKQAIWRHGATLFEKAKIQQQIDHDAASDFGDDDDENNDESDSIKSPVELVFSEFCSLKNNGAQWLNENDKLSRLKLKGGLQAILGIRMSWHQFDLLFRRLAGDSEGEVTWKAFHRAFGDPVPGNAMSNDMLAVKEGLVLMIDRLEEHELTLTQAWQAFDRDNSGAISVAEFSTLIQFLTHKEGGEKLTKHQIYLMMAALDSSCDRLIQHAEFMKFIFIIWSHRLMQLQQYSGNDPEHAKLIAARKVALRKALRKNFSRPFRDAMRCVPVTVPGPFQNLLDKFHLHYASNETPLQVWQVLKGEHNAFSGTAPVALKEKTKSKKVASGKNTVTLTKLKRQQGPKRDHAVLRAPARVDLDSTQELIYDNKTQKMTSGNLHRIKLDF